MTDERRRQISSLFNSMLGLSQKKRLDFLARECAGDDQLRHELDRVFQHSNFETEQIAEPFQGTEPTSLAAGELVAERYRIERLIGRGGMGEVYEAFDLLLKEDVALKTLRADLAHNESVVQRFHKEIQLARKVTHPNVCRIFEVGVHSSRSLVLFFVMELLQGETLASRIGSGRLSRAQAFPIAVQLAEGLQAAHEAGIVHADFKSANIILVSTSSGVRAVITDFGIAHLDPKFLSGDQTPAGGNRRLAGTVAYMSPEQFAEGAVTAASDIYSFGIVLFEMASARLPFEDRHLIQSAMQRADGGGVSIRALVPDIDRRWEEAIGRCLQMDPTHRFVSAGELAAWFRAGAWRNPRYWTRRDWLRNSTAAGLLLGAGLGGWIWESLPYRPLPESLESYQTGVKALHSMTYETARKYLQQAVASDPNFALAHASLARAYDELDYTDRAQNEVLVALAAAEEFPLSKDDDRKLRATHLMIARDYERAEPLFREIEEEARGPEKSAAALEYGWLAQQREVTTVAVAAYERALKLDPSYAAAKLRLAYMIGRLGGPSNLSLALETFAEAEKLYSLKNDYEGVTETLLQRANLFNRRRRQNEAMSFINKALIVAQTIGNRYQEIMGLLLKSQALRNNDNVSAAAFATQAYEFAVRENMDNVATRSLMDLGSVQLVSRDIKSAEKSFKDALERARRSKFPRNEARAQLLLGSLYEQDHRPIEAKQFIEQSMSVYTQAGYRRESIQAAGLLGGVLRQLGENQEGIRVLREALPGAIQLQDASVEAQLRERLAQNLQDCGLWLEAISEYEQAGNLYGATLQGEYMRVQRAGLEWRLNRGKEAEHLLNGAQRFEKKTPDPRLSSLIAAQLAWIALMKGELERASSLVEKSPTPDSGEDVEREIELLRALVAIRLERNERIQFANRLIGELDDSMLKGEAALARLSIAEAFAAAGERDLALRMAGAVLAYCKQQKNIEGELRAHLVAARTSAAPADVKAHLQAISSSLVRLKVVWTPEDVGKYLARSDIKFLSAGLAF